MEYKIKVGVSNRHVHLTKEDYDFLFDEELTLKYKLNQIGEFASNQTVLIKGPKGEIDNVRILGPFRLYNQVEISRHDARILGVNPPVRKSGDLNGAENITITGPKGSVELKESCIIANRHLHMPSKEALKYNLKDNQKVKVVISGDRSGIIDAYAKITDNSATELHLDTDDANAFGLKGNEELDIII